MKEQKVENHQQTHASFHKKHLLAFTILICGVLFIIIGFLGYYIGTSQHNTTPKPKPSPISPTQTLASPTIIPTTATATPVDDSFTQFVKLFGKIVPILRDSHFEQLSTLQPQTEVTCNDEAPYNPTICQGQPNGTRVSGYTIGYEASEGSIYSRDQFIQTLTNYVNDHGPFSYGSNRIDGNTASITLYNHARDWKLAVVLNKDNPEHLWKIQYTLLGVNLE